MSRFLAQWSLVGVFDFSLSSLHLLFWYPSLRMFPAMSPLFSPHTPSLAYFDGVVRWERFPVHRSLQPWSRLHSFLCGNVMSLANSHKHQTQIPPLRPQFGCAQMFGILAALPGSDPLGSFSLQHWIYVWFLFSLLTFLSHLCHPSLGSSSPLHSSSSRSPLDLSLPLRSCHFLHERISHLSCSALHWIRPQLTKTSESQTI